MRSKKASSRVTSPKQETAAAAGAACRSTKRTAIGNAAVENVAKRQFQKTASRAIQAHTRASGQSIIGVIVVVLFVTGYFGINFLR